MLPKSAHETGGICAIQNDLEAGDDDLSSVVSC